jgi:tRNA-Thr(GGU) m(6)t(6)A37 methyltransferase TsaA
MEEIPENWPEMKLRPVGLVRSEIQTPMLQANDSDLELRERMDRIREYHRKVKNALCELIVFTRYEALLDSIEDFSHILVLYWPHLIDPQRRKLRKVHPMGRKDLPRQGIFATCSPARPNPVLVSAVRLLKRVGNKLEVKGLEAVNGSPIIDIKPYSRNYYGAENPVVPAWMEQIHRELEMDNGHQDLH